MPAPPSGKQPGFITPDKAAASGLVFASAYALSQDMGKSGMSRLLKLGLPHYEGTDKKGRLCKYVRPADADAWRSIHTRPTVDGTGKLRGVPVPASPPPAAPVAEPEARSERASRAAPAKGRERDGDFSVAERVAEARAAVAESDAEIRRLRLAKEAGKLLDRKAAFDIIAEFMDQCGATLGKLGDAHASVHARELNVGEHEAFIALRSLGDRTRADLERYASEAQRRLATLGGDGGLEADPGADPA